MEELKPCPFCGKTPEITKHFKDEAYTMVHRCKVFGALSIEWTSKEAICRKWNTRHGS